MNARDKSEFYKLFQRDWYLEKYPDVMASGMDPLEHYVNFGYIQGRKPHPLFEPQWFQYKKPIVAGQRLDPLRYYSEQGWKKGLDPHPLFKANWYLENNQDVAESGMEPLQHYWESGYKQGINPHPLFDVKWYLAFNKDVAKSGMEPLLHYSEYGWKEGRNPHPFFNVRWYLEINQDVEKAGLEPLRHYSEFGWKEGRHPHPHFHTRWYLEQYPEVAKANLEPLAHYLAIGWKKEFKPYANFNFARQLAQNPAIIENLSDLESLLATSESPALSNISLYESYDMENWERGEKKVLVFTSDIIPLGGLPTSGGGLRSWQLIQMLKASGWNVIYSMPGESVFVKKHWAELSQEDQENAWGFDKASQVMLVEKHQPHVVIFTYAPCCTLAKGEMPCALISDFHGPTNIESALMSGASLKEVTATTIENISRFDAYITVNEPQRIYWSSMLVASGKMPLRDDFTIVPVCVTPKIENFSPDVEHPVVVYAGSFNPWQDPSASLLQTARYLKEKKVGQLHIYGKPHADWAHFFVELISELSSFDCVKIHDFVPHEELAKRMGKAVCVLEIMAYNFERDLALTTRTIYYLSLGTPIIYSNYNWLAEKISSYGAGWCLEPGDQTALEKVLDEVTSGEASIISEKSKNALRLVQAEFTPAIYEKQLDGFLGSKVNSKLDTAKKLAQRTSRS